MTTNKLLKWTPRQEEKLREIAEAKGLGMNELLRRILDSYLEGLEIERS